jgi:glycosyltransferase involved in cell wall biosynthesis
MANSFEFIYSLKKEFNVKATCIYNPLNIKDIKNKSKFRSKKFYKSKNLRILNIGRFTDQKDQITLLRALKNLSNKIKFEAIIVGRGVLKQKLKNFIHQNQLENKIKLVNFLNNPYPIIRQCNLFILSSKFEGLPNVLLESISLNKFVISSDCPTGPKEILLNGKGGLLFKTTKSDDLEKKISFFIKNKKKCQNMLRVAKKNLSRFDYNKNLRKYYKLIQDIN